MAAGDDSDNDVPCTPHLLSVAFFISAMLCRARKNSQSGPEAPK